MNIEWTDKEINFLRDNYLYMTDKQIAQILGRSVSGVKTKRQKLGFEKDKAHRKYTFNDVISEFEKTDYILLSDKNDYINASENTLKYICPRHRDKGILTISLGHLQSGRGCYYCGREITENAHFLSDEEIEIYGQDICNKKNFIYSGFHREDKLIYIDYICPNHKEVGIQSMRKGNIKRDNIIGCPYCIDTKKYKFSKGEKKIDEFLSFHNIVAIRQYHFNGCQDERPLPFDFYLPDYNKCIEYDGEHHYHPVTFNGISKEEALFNHVKTKQHDEIKDKYCEEHGIELLRIPYFKFNSIEQLLIDFLFKERNIA